MQYDTSDAAVQQNTMHSLSLSHGHCASTGTQTDSIEPAGVCMLACACFYKDIFSYGCSRSIIHWCIHTSPNQRLGLHSDPECRLPSCTPES